MACPLDLYDFFRVVEIIMVEKCPILWLRECWPFFAVTDRNDILTRKLISKVLRVR